MKYLKTEPYFIQSLIHVANLQSVFVEEETGKKGAEYNSNKKFSLFVI